MGQPPAKTMQTVVFPILVEVLGSWGKEKQEWWALTGEGKSGGKDPMPQRNEHSRVDVLLETRTLTCGLVIKPCLTLS